MWGLGKSVERGEENVGKNGEMLENVGEVWESVLECGGGMGKEAWGDVFGVWGEVWEMCWGGKR